MPPIDDNILWYYNKGREIDRLSSGSQLEYARTRQIIKSRIVNKSLSIADIGGGPGKYSIWLTQIGHSVHLLDPVPLHLEQARIAASKAEITLAGYYLADAEDLPFDDRAFDVVLMLGPLYHLTEQHQRVYALKEAYRVLKPGGQLFAAAISRYGTVIDCFFKGFYANSEYVSLMQRAMRDGHHRNKQRQSGLFTTSYFHTAEELKLEVETACFADVGLVAIEGPWSRLPDFEEKWKDDVFRELLLETLAYMESDPSTVGFGGHIMAIACRPME